MVKEKGINFTYCSFGVCRVVFVPCRYSMTSRNTSRNHLMALHASTAEFVDTIAPTGTYGLGAILCRAEPQRAHGKTGEPQNPPFELGIHVAGKKPHDNRRCTAREYRARGLAAIHPVPKDRALATLHLDVPER